MGDSLSPQEMGLTAKDLGISTRPDRQTISQAHAKIARFHTPEYTASYEGVAKQEPPYFTAFQTPDHSQTIQLIGTAHYHQEKDERVKEKMIQKLDSQLAAYLDETRTDPSKRVVMIEGAEATDTASFQTRLAQQDKTLKDMFQNANIKTKKEAVDKYGEMGAVLFEAIEKDVPIMSPEPSFDDIVTKQKEAGIPAEDIALKQAILNLDTYTHRGQLRDQRQFSLDEVFTALKTACEQSGWQKELAADINAKLTGTPETDQPVMQSFVDTILPQMNARMQTNNIGFNLVDPNLSWAFDPSDRDVYNRLHSPNTPIAVFNRMANIANEFRDDYILDQIVDAVDAGKSPFVVYGSGHTVKLTPALATLYPQVQTPQAA